MLELLNWVKDGKYRIKILELLEQKPLLSSEIASELKINRSSTSRILKSMVDRNLVSFVTSGSRTRSYVISDTGRTILKEYRES